MSDFRIRVDVEINEDKARGQLEGLGKDISIKPKITLDLSKARAELGKFKKEFQNAFRMDNKATSDIKKLTNALKGLKQISQGASGKGSGKGSVNSLVSEYKTLANTVEKLQKQMNKGGLGDDSIKRTSDQIKKLESQMKNLYSQMDDSSRRNIDLFNTQKSIKGLADMNQNLIKIDAKANSLKTAMNSIEFKAIDDGQIKNVIQDIERLQSVAKEDINLDLNAGEILGELDQIESKIKNFQKVEKIADSFDEIKSSISSAGGEVEQFESTIKELVDNAGKLDGKFEKAFDGASKGLKKLKSDMKSMQSSGGKGGLLGNIFGSKKDFLSNFAQFKVFDLLGDFVTDGIRNVARAWGETIVETDKAMTDLGKVLPKTFASTSKNMKEYGQQATQVAIQTGKTNVDIINGTTKALQSGIKNMDDALKYSKGSAIFANVGDMEQEVSDRYLAGIMSAYGGVDKALQPVRKTVQGMGKDYDNLTNFVDQANYAGNNFAVSTADVGEILMQSSSALSTMGVSMEQNVAMGVAMNETLQDSSRSGNALKSIASNMAGVRTSLKDGSIEANKTAKALSEIAGIEVWNKQTGEIKDMYSTMDELASKWDTLNEDQQNALGATIAGKQIILI